MQFKGWGTSLAWWANIPFDDTVVDTLCDLLFSKQGLGLNIVRYNLGAGSNPNNPIPNLRSGAMVPCLQNNSFSTLDAKNDPLQIRILNKAIALEANHVELFSNSPPWWMTKNGLSTGNTFSTNLNRQKAGTFANFLSKSYDLFHELYPKVSLSLEPFNEPSNPFWTQSSHQEGAFFDYKTRIDVIKALKQQNPDLHLATADEFSSLFALAWYLVSPKNLVNQINIHGYSFYKFHKYWIPDDLDIFRFALRKISTKPIWMSEFGMGGPNTWQNALILASQIFRDLRTLRPEAWIYWQAVENTSQNSWGLLQLPFDLTSKNITISLQYWILMHFTKTLQQNDQFSFLGKSILKVTNKLTNKIAFVILNKNKKPLKLKKKFVSYLKANKLVSCFISTHSKIMDLKFDVPSHLPPQSITSITLVAKN